MQPPSEKELSAINKAIERLNAFEEQQCMPDDAYFVDLLPEQFRLTMAQVQDRSNTYWVIKPQLYDELEPLTRQDLEFYGFKEHNSCAVTGSGSDTWGVYQPGLLQALEDIAKRCEAIAA